MNRSQRLRILPVLLALAVAGCPEGDLAEPAPVTTPDATTTPPTPREPDPRANVARLTPEQVSNQLAMALDVRFYSENPLFGYDTLRSPDFAIPLGGVDFRIASNRDYSTRLQTLLVARAVAWLGALTFLGTEFETPNLLTCTVGCAPTGSPDGAWETQAQEFHWRIFGRPADDQELTDMATLYDAALTHEYEPYLAWNTVIYALLSTAEFWHR